MNKVEVFYGKGSGKQELILTKFNNTLISTVYAEKAIAPAVLGGCKARAEIIKTLVKNYTKFWIVVKQPSPDELTYSVSVTKPTLLPGFNAPPFNVKTIIEVNYE